MLTSLTFSQVGEELAVSGSEDIPVSQSEYVFFTSQQAASLYRITQKTAQYYIEMGGFTHIPTLLNHLKLQSPDWCISLTTRTSFQQPVTDVICQAIMRNWPGTEPKISDIKTCLHEALLNSVIHGNLNLSLADRSIEDFQLYYRRILNKLRDERLAQKRITIMVWKEDDSLTICIADEGEGFSLSQPEHALDSLSGRGLELIKNLAFQRWQQHSNTLFMQFAL